MAQEARARARALQRKRPRLQGGHPLVECELQRAQAKIAKGQAFVGTSMRPFGARDVRVSGCTPTPTCSEDTSSPPAHAVLPGGAAAPLALPAGATASSTAGSDATTMTMLSDSSSSLRLPRRNGEVPSVVEPPVIDVSNRLTSLKTLARAPSRQSSTPTASPGSLVAYSPATSHSKVPTAKRVPRRTRAASASDGRLTLSTPGKKTPGQKITGRRLAAVTRAATRAREQERDNVLACSSAQFTPNHVASFTSPQLPLHSMDSSAGSTSSRRRLQREYSSASSGVESFAVAPSSWGSAQPLQMTTVATGSGGLQQRSLGERMTPAPFALPGLMQQIPFACTAPGMGLTYLAGPQHLAGPQAEGRWVASGDPRAQGGMTFVSGTPGARNGVGDPSADGAIWHTSAHDRWSGGDWYRGTWSEPARQMEPQAVVPASVSMLRNVFQETTFGNFAPTQAPQRQQRMTASTAAARPLPATVRQQSVCRRPTISGVVDCESLISPTNAAYSATATGSRYELPTLRPRGAKATK